MGKIMLVGGGSGGHLTPLVAIAEKLKAIDASVEIIYTGQKNEDLHAVTAHTAIDSIQSIRAGKFRRYHGESFVSHMLDFKTLFFNVRDLFRFFFGTIEAFYMLGKVKPDVIFLKGGFVCVPVGYAARVRKIPYITHDSDAIPGLANKLTAKHAVYNTVALPVEFYPYDAHKTKQVGIPLQSGFRKVSKDDKQIARKSLGIDPDDLVLFSVGGGLGAQRLNNALIDIAPKLLKEFTKIRIFHVTGIKLYDEVIDSYKKNGLIDTVDVIDFTTKLDTFSAAADVVLTRAGATNIAEFATQAKACVVVPSPFLTGGQQLHNAELLKKKNAAVIVQENAIHTLHKELSTLLSDKKLREEYERKIHELSIPDSATKLAKLLLSMMK